MTAVVHCKRRKALPAAVSLACTSAGCPGVARQHHHGGYAASSKMQTQPRIHAVQAGSRAASASLIWIHLLAGAHFVAGKQVHHQESNACLVRVLPKHIATDTYWPAMAVLPHQSHVHVLVCCRPLPSPFLGRCVLRALRRSWTPQLSAR